LRRSLPILALISALGGCVQKEPGVVLIRTVPVREPVDLTVAPPPPPPAPVAAAPRPQVRCPSVGPSPVYADRDEELRDAPSIYEQVQMLLAGRRQRMERERQLANALRDCAER
jgi:hypothetical protein